MSRTGHDEFDQWKDEFSVTVRDIEAAMRKRAAHYGNIDNDNQDASELIRKASSILEKMFSVAKSISETEKPALKQELFDVYKACKMQLKTYKSLHKQTKLFRNTNMSNSTPIGISASGRAALFATITTTSECSKIVDNGSSTNNSPDHINSNTQGRVRKQNLRLREAVRSIVESEQVAQKISGELEDQRETLSTTQGRLGQFSSMAEHSKYLLNSMNKSWWRKW